MIRTAEPADAAVIAELLDQLGYPTTAAEVPERLRRIRSEGRGEVFVSVVGGEVGGLVSVQVGPGLTRSEDTAYVSTLVVAEGIRGKGVGRELLEVAEDYARKHGCPRSWSRQRIIAMEPTRSTSDWGGTGPGDAMQRCWGNVSFVSSC
jgi:GNAT superfamily N-acetyltransferase